MKKRMYVLFIAILVFSGYSCKTDKEVRAFEDNSPPVNVQVMAVDTEGDQLSLTASGKVEASESIMVSTRMMGYIEKINVNIGDKVRKGQPLIKINSADINAKLAQVNSKITEAEAALQNAEKNFNRFKSLYNDNSATQKEMDDMATQYDMAKARVEAAVNMRQEINAQFSYSNINSPITGVVTSKMAETGDLANPGMPMLEIESQDKLQVSVLVPESEITKIKLNTPVEVKVKSNDAKISGKVKEINTSAKNTGGQYVVKVDLKNDKANVLPGMYANVYFPEVKIASSTITIHATSVLHQGQLQGVYVVGNKDRALLRWLRLGRQYGDNVEVLSGLSKDEMIIVSSDSKIYNGAKISIQ